MHIHIYIHIFKVIIAQSNIWIADNDARERSIDLKKWSKVIYIVSTIIIYEYIDISKITRKIQLHSKIDKNLFVLQKNVGKKKQETSIISIIKNG